MSVPIDQPDQPARGADASTNGGTVLEVLLLGVVSWVAPVALANLLIVLLQPSRDKAEVIGYTLLGATLLCPLLFAFLYGLLRNRRLNPTFVFIGWCLYLAAYTIVSSLSLLPIGVSLLRVLWMALWVLIGALVLTLVTLAGAYIRHRRIERRQTAEAEHT